MEGAAGKGQSETGLTKGGGIVTDAPAVLQHIDKLEVIKLFMNRIEEMKHFTVIILCDKFEKAKYKGRNVSPALVRHITLEMINPNTLPTWIM